MLQERRGLVVVGNWRMGKTAASFGGAGLIGLIQLK